MKRVRRFRNLVCAMLVISILLSIYTPISAEEESEEYESITVEVEFSDNVGESEYLTFMQTDENVYVSASELATRLGYQVSISEDYVVFSKAGGDSSPSEYTILYFDSTEVMHTIFSMEVDGYEAPFPSIKNGGDAWVPFEYTLLILGSSVAVIDGTFCIDMPDTTIIDIFYDVLKNGETYSFDWERDFGYSNLNVDIIGSSSHLINLFNGMLKFDGDSWAQLFESIVLDSSAYDSKYGEDIALLLCTESDNELKAEVKEMQKFTDLLSEDGKLGKMLTTYSANIDANVESCTKTCETILEKVQNGNSSIAQYNKSYQALEKALDKQTWFSDTGENILVVQKGLSDVTTFLDAAITVLEVVGYAEEFQNQDEFSIDALSMVLDGQSENSIAPEVMLESMQEYVEYLKTDILEYSTRRYFDENLDSWIKKALGISKALGTQANIELLAWSLISSFVPRLSDSLSAADKFELALYAYVYATDANNTFRTSLWDTLFTDNEVTAESMYTLSQQCYVSLKSWYITREAAVASLKGKSSAVQEEIQPLIDEQNSVNEEIAELLVKLKNADTTNESLIYGFLPEDNESYLESYAEGESSSLLVPLQAAATIDEEQIWMEFLSSGAYLEYTGSWETSYFGAPTGWEKMSPEYAIVDLNADGVKELLIQATYERPFYTTWTFALNGSNVVFVDGDYGYGSFEYSSLFNAVLVSPEWKPFDGTGSYPFYQIRNMEYVYLFQICQDEGIWYFIDADGSKQAISDEERESYFADVVSFDWEELESISVADIGELYSDVINEYYEVCSLEDDVYINNKLEYDEQYPEVTTVCMLYYHVYSDGAFYYTYYDINQDGNMELLISYGQDGSYGIVDIYTYNGTEALKAIDRYSLGDRSSLIVCTDGTLILYGSGGAAYNGYDFFEIDSDGYSIKSVATYTGDWEDRPDYPYYDGSNYLTYEEMENILDSYTKVDLTVLGWVFLA